LLIISGVEKCSDELIEEGVAYLSNPTDDTCIIFRHNGSSVRGKRLVEALRASHVVVEVPCLEIKKDADRANFVQSEFKAANRNVTSSAIRALLDAFADDLAELASACSQLLQDSTEQITDSTVERYYGGRIETNAFKVADAAFAGQAGQALALLRHALATGADPVPMVAALSMKVRQLAKLHGNRSASPQSVGMAPWQLDRARKDLVGWSEEGLAEAIKAIATADAAAKGAERDPVYSLERLVQLLATKGEPKSA
jgi:DNA polymerase-3 subunit delta